MVTVDDLVISLTIKETSNLGKLQKTLEDFKDGKIVQKGADSGLKVALMKIKNKLRSLIGNIVPTKDRPAAMAAEAGALRKSLKKDTRVLAEKLLPEKGVEAMKEEFDVSTREELIDKMEEKLQEWTLRLEMIMSREWAGESATRYMAVLRDFISRRDVSDDLRKSFLTRIENKIGEFNFEIAELLKAVGVTAVANFKAYSVKEQFKQKVARPGGGEWLSPSQIARILKIDQNNPIFKELRGISSEATSVIDYLNKATEKLGIKLTPETFTKTGAIKTDELKAIVAEMFLLYETKFKAEGAVPSGFHAVFRDLIEKNFPAIKGKRIFSQIKPSLAILHGDLENLKQAFGTEIAKVLSENNLGFVQLKQILSESNLDQFAKYQELLGNVTAVASVVKRSFLEAKPDVATKQMNVLNRLVELGAEKKVKTEIIKETTKLEEEEKTEAKVIENLQERNIYRFLSEEEVKALTSLSGAEIEIGTETAMVEIKNILNKLYGTVATSEQIQKLYDNMSKILKEAESTIQGEGTPETF